MANPHVEKGSTSSLTEFQKKYVKENGLKKTDIFMAIHLGASKNAVNYYRVKVLKLIKESIGRPRFVENTVIKVSEINEEIYALQKYANYPSLMSGAHGRMKYLIQLRDGVRV